jgi:hypothetical protein
MHPNKSLGSVLVALQAAHACHVLNNVGLQPIFHPLGLARTMVRNEHDLRDQSRG